MNTSDAPRQFYSPLQKARHFKEYVLNEAEFYKIYFSDLVLRVLNKWNDELNPMGGVKSITGLDENARRRCFMIKWTKFEDLFGVVVQLLDVHLAKFNSDFVEFERQLRNHGTLYNVPSESILRLALWDSTFTNDEYARLSPFGPFMILVGERMRHHPIGIFDALGQMFLKESDEPYPDEQLWRVDLLRAQLFLIVIQGVFNEFFKNTIVTNFTVMQMFDAWDDCIKIKEEAIRKLNELTGEKVDPGEKEHPHSHSQAEEGLIEEVNRKRNRAEKKLLNIRNVLVNQEYRGLIDEELQEGLLNYLSGSTKKADLLTRLQLANEHNTGNELIRSMYEATYLFHESHLPPLVQLINGNASAWASDDEVPAIIVIDRRKAEAEKRNKRLEAYAAIPHELGHVIADSFVNDALIKHLQGAIGSKEDLNFGPMWQSWMAEIVADLSGVTLFGLHSINGLWTAIKDINRPDNIITKREDSTSGYSDSPSWARYDTHPVPILRIKIVLELALKLAKRDLMKLSDFQQLVSKWTIWGLSQSTYVITEGGVKKCQNEIGGRRAELRKSILSDLIDYQIVSEVTLDELPIKTRYEETKSTSRDIEMIKLEKRLRGVRNELKEKLEELDKTEVKGMSLLQISSKYPEVESIIDAMEKIEWDILNRIIEYIVEVTDGSDIDSKYGLKRRSIYSEIDHRDYDIMRFSDEIPKVIEVIFTEKLPCLNNRTMISLFDHIKNNPDFKSLAMSFTPYNNIF